ncbi:hypothetical protein ACFLYB_05310 [Chloroflexota bacterium]
MKAQNVDLTVYIQGHTFVGSVTIPKGVRLTDFLNNGFQPQTDFLVLEGVTAKLTNGSRETSKVVYINKKSIQMITTHDLGTTRGIGAMDGPKQYPYIQKRQKRATINLPGFKLHGYLYCAETREVADLFTEKQRFLPCTDTLIYNVSGDSNWKAEFASVNKDHISSFKED